MENGTYIKPIITPQHMDCGQEGGRRWGDGGGMIEGQLYFLDNGCF